MIARVLPAGISGLIQAPPSKSYMQRACAAALLAGGRTTLINPGYSNDDLAAIDVIRQLGASVEKEQGALIIESRGIHPQGAELNCGESGLGIRMFTPLAALSPASLTISGGGSLSRRPMDFFDTVLPQLAVNIKSAGGRLPMQVQGPLRPADIEVDGSLSSQFLTGLLMAYSAAGARDKTIRVNNLNSRPYIEVTLQVLAAFGLPVPVHQSYRQFYFGPETVPPDPGLPQSRIYSIEGDWSNAAFWLVAGAVAGPVAVRGMNLQSPQADRAILHALESAGANISFRDHEIHIQPAGLQAFRFDATDCPDLFPPLVALAAFAVGESVLTGLHRLQFKESNRGLSLQEEFGKLGVQIGLSGDEMSVRGGQAIRSAVVSSHNDHRIAMACAIAALKADGPVLIEGAEAVSKSYPGFWNDLLEAGAAVELEPAMAE